jgi:hypothetical protein
MPIGVDNAKPSCLFASKIYKRINTVNTNGGNITFLAYCKALN